MSSKIAAKRASVQAGIEPFRYPVFSEINPKNPNYKVLLIDAYSYANYAFDYKFHKQHVVEFMKEHMNLKGGCIPELLLAHKGATCWLLKNGVEGLHVEDLKTDLKELYNKYNTDHTEIPKRTNTAIINENTNNVIGVLEGIIDDVYLGKKDIQEPIDIFRSTQVKISVIEEWFQRQLDDITNNPDDYKKSKKELAAIKFIMNHIESYKAELDQRVVRQVKRKVRKKKVDPSKMVSRVKYLEKDTEFNLKSIHPVNIIGMNALWIFNVKYRILTHYVAADEVGLMVRGSAVINYDPDKSLQKRLRPNKVKELIEKLVESGKVTQRTFLDTINGKSKAANGRINASCVLIKVYR